MSETVKSWFAEVDRSNRSDPNPTASTAAECLESCELNIQEALNNRREVYRRWTDIVRRQGAHMLDAAGNIRTDKFGNKLYTKDGAVLLNDVARVEAEVKHWREMSKWWREKVAEDPDRVRICGGPAALTAALPAVDDF